MKIQIEIDTSIKDCEILIRCPELNEEVQRLQKLLAENSSVENSIIYYRNEKEYYFSVQEILFFETEGGNICAHTRDNTFHVKYKLYELEEILPRYFVRVSKSTILNIREIYSITKNITSSSVVEFNHTHKKVYVSRGFYKSLKEAIDGNK